MQATNAKEAARHFIKRLPEGLTWKDLMQAIDVRQAIKTGLADSEAGRLLNVKDVRAKFGLLQ